MPQVTSIVSEPLQAAIRSLLPSQQGFTEDLQAQNVIVPIIDLTSVAEGSSLPVSMQQAISYVSNTSIIVNNGTSTIANVGGFYLLEGIIDAVFTSAGIQTLTIDITDGATPKTLFKVNTLGAPSGATANSTSQNVKIYFFLRSGDSVSITASAFCAFGGTIRQIADLNGTLLNPSGFVAE